VSRRTRPSRLVVVAAAVTLLLSFAPAAARAQVEPPPAEVTANEVCGGDGCNDEIEAILQQIGLCPAGLPCPDEVLQRLEELLPVVCATEVPCSPEEATEVLEDLVPLLCPGEISCDPSEIQQQLQEIVARACADEGCNPSTFVALVLQIIADRVPASTSPKQQMLAIQLQLDDLDESLPQSPACGVVDKALVMPSPFDRLELPSVSGCLDESGNLEPAAIPGAKFALRSAQVDAGVGVGQGAYCQSGGENDPEDTPEDSEESDPYVWTSVRGYGATPKSYVIGNCHDDWALSVEKPDAGEGMSGAYINDEFGGCGYITRANVETLGGSSAPACGSGYPHVEDFGQYFNCSNALARQEQCSNRDGTAVPNDEACHRYFNVRPWKDVTQPQTELPFLSAVPAKNKKGTDRFKWRYVTRDGRYVLVKDTGRASGTGRWIFVNRSCLPDNLPGPHVAPGDLYG
jgi:hypothetical protein